VNVIKSKRAGSFDGGKDLVMEWVARFFEANGQTLVVESAVDAKYSKSMETADAAETVSLST